MGESRARGAHTLVTTGHAEWDSTPRDRLSLPGSRRCAGAQRSFQAAQRVTNDLLIGDRGGIRPTTAKRTTPIERGAGGRDHTGAQLGQLGDALGKIGAPLRGELGQRGGVGVFELQGRVGKTALVEVEAGAQRKLFAEEWLLARAEQRGEALVGAQHGGAPGAGLVETQLAGVQPAAVGHLLTLAPPGPYDQRVRRGELAHVGVSGGDAVGEQHAVEGCGGGVRLALGVQLREPRAGLALRGDRHGVDHRGPCGGHGRGLGCGRRTSCAEPPTAPSGAHGVEHHHSLRLSSLALAQQVAPVGRAELPGELQLEEEEEALSHGRTVSSMPPARFVFATDTRSVRMSDTNAPKGLRERLAGGTEDRLGKALTDLFENSLLGGALGRASDAREKAAQAQELAMGALNLPSAADIERLTRRVRSVSQRLEGIEDGVHSIGRSLSGQSIDGRLAAIEEQLRSLSGKLDGGRSAATRPSTTEPSATQPSVRRAAANRPSATEPSATQPSVRRAAANRPSATEPSATQPSVRRAAANRPSATEPSATQPSVRRAAANRPSATEPSATQPSVKRSAANRPSAKPPSVKRSGPNQPSAKRVAAKSSAAKRTAGRSSKPAR